MELSQVLNAVFANALVAVIAYYRNAVTRSGATAGFVAGTLIFAAGTGYWAALMLFFLSSTLFGKLYPSRRKGAKSMHAKGGRRDAWQVFANTGPSTAAAIAVIVSQAPVAILVFGAAMAAATADTWSSELGILSKSAPVSILTLRPMDGGLSGAVSTLGLIAGALGAVATSGVIAVTALATVSARREALIIFLIAAALGVAGTLLDSVLGATIQARYRTKDGRLTERPTDSVGSPHTLDHGIRWFTNDLVNLATTSSIAALALLLGLLMGL